MKKSFQLLFVALIVLLSACASTSSMRNAPLTAGKARTYEANYRNVVDAALVAVSESGFAVEDAYEVDDHTFAIIGKTGAGGYSWGEYVRVVIDGANDRQTTVRVYTKRKLATNVAARGDYAGPIFSKIYLALR